MNFLWSGWPVLDLDDPTLKPVLEKIRQLTAKQSQYFQEVLVPEMEAAGLVRLKPEACNPTQAAFLENLFRKDLLPVLTPIAMAEEQHFAGRILVCSCTWRWG